MTFKYEPCAIGITLVDMNELSQVPVLARGALLGRPQYHTQSKIPASVANEVAASSGGNLNEGT